MPSLPTSPTTRCRTGTCRWRYRHRAGQPRYRAGRGRCYDNELLDAHFVAGDGRANENIGLTAVHHVFHSEHNRLVEHTKAVVLADAAAMLAGGATQAEAVAFLNEWLVDDVATVPVGAAIDDLVWDGERLFQAAKFGTEMQYQHLVFEEFARKIQPNINVFLVPDGFDVTIDPSIVAEFAHVVYRFGHSMLTESIDRFDPTFTEDHIGLIEGFLNPIQFLNNGTNAVVDADIAAGAIIRGMTRQVGNEIDEFVTSALRNNLLGLPLDLATINLARGRDTGVPSLNAGPEPILRSDQSGRSAETLRKLGRFCRTPQARSVDHQLHRRIRHALADHQPNDDRRQARCCSDPYHGHFGRRAWQCRRTLSIS